jgi:hypothetical protein
LLPTSGLAEFWQTCLKLPLIDRSFWGSLLAALTWTVCLTRIRFVVRPVTTTTTTTTPCSLLYSVLHLFSFWAGTSAAVPHGVQQVSLPSLAGANGGSPSVGIGMPSSSGRVPAVGPPDDEDLLD